MVRQDQFFRLYVVFFELVKRFFLAKGWRVFVFNAVVEEARYKQYAVDSYILLKV